MSVKVKQLPCSEIEISGEISAEEFNRFFDKAVDLLSKNLKISGFRQGHIPRDVLIGKVGQGAVLNKAAELAIQKTYPEILKERKIEAIGPPRVTITKIARGDSFGYKIKTAVLPEVDLPENYLKTAREIFSEKEEIIVSDKEIDNVLEYLRKSQKDKDGNPASLDDNFARKVGKFGSLKELKDAVRQNLIYEKKARSREKKRLQALDAILREIKLDIPDVLIEWEKIKMLSELKASVTDMMNLSWEDYLAHTRKTEKEILNGFNADAARRTKYGLLLEKLANDLGVEVATDEVDEAIKRLNIPQPRKVDNQELKNYAYGIIRNEKVFRLLEGVKAV
jgi:FKBP-type peptidyl-prolyl cis-trans isomerase (trigger factor)